MFLVRICSFYFKSAKLKPNQYDFLDLIRPPSGSQIPITNEQKQKIHQQIDKKMQQLQNTGLSRQQILLSKYQKGIPLAMDPFFQYLKNNRLARQIYLKKNDRLTVQKIIDIALRQDIGPDPSYSRSRDVGVIKTGGRAELMHDLEKKQRLSFDPNSYYGNVDTTVDKLYEQLKNKQPLRHIYTPINRYQKMKKYQRKLKKYDIHWRNVELLRQFLTPYGNLKNRWSNRLSPSDQKKVAIAIKSARHNCALPFYGRILNANKKNITNLQDQAKEVGLQNVNLSTGEIFYSKPRSMDSMELEKQQKSDVDYQYQQMIKGDNYKLWIETPDEQKPQDQQLYNAYLYTKNLKVQQNKIKSEKEKAEGQTEQKKKKIYMKNLKKMALKQITDIEQNEEQEKDQKEPLTPQQLQQCKNAYENQKLVLSQKFQEDPLYAIKMILEEKTKI